MTREKQRQGNVGIQAASEGGALCCGSRKEADDITASWKEQGIAPSGVKHGLGQVERRLLKA